MDRTLGIFGIVALVLILLAAGMVAGAVNTTNGISGQDDALKIARNFVVNEPTYKFDGMKDTLHLNVTGSNPDAKMYDVSAEFTSAHSGYGDRSDKIVLEVLTPHTCNITVTNGNVTTAVMDGSYDMLTQKTTG